MKRFLAAAAATSICCLMMPSSALAQPANDTCGAAQVIPVTSGGSGTVAGDNTLATDDAGLPACTLSTSASSGTKGVWYSFIGTGNRVSFDTCGGTTDFTIRVFCGDCNTPVCAASDDDGCDNNTLAPKMSMCTTLGTNYLMLFSRFGTGTTAAYTLNWSDSGAACPASGQPSCAGLAPANDDCTGAVPLVIGGASAIGNNIAATADPSVPPTCNSVAPGNSVWYSFVGNGSTVNINMCTANTGSNAKVNIYTGVCGGLVCAQGIAGSSGASPLCATRNDVPGGTAICTVSGQTYFIAVSNETNGAGLFEIGLTSAVCVPPPVNDTCATATTIVPGVNQTADTAQATNESPTPPTCSGLSTFNLGVWYTFVPPTNNRYIASTCNPATNFNTRVYVYSGSCGGLTCALANATASPACGIRSDAATVSFCAVAGVPHYILVTNDTTGTGTLELSLTDTGTDCSPPVNDNCAGAVTLSVGVPVTATNVNAANESPVPTTCNGLSTFNLGMWYTFTEGATARRLSISTCSASTNYNTRVYAYTGSCGAFTCVNANATASPACGARSDAAEVVFCTTPGTQYFFLVTNDTTGTGTFGLLLSDTGIGCTPPPNDLCANATVVSTTPFPSTVSADTATADIDTTCNAAANVESRNGVWYRYTPTEPGNLSFVESGSADVVFAVFTGSDCSSLGEVFCNTDETGAVRFSVSAGTTYYILCSLASNTTAAPPTYSITINFAGDPGACCNGSGCTITAGIGACTTAGGTFLGYGTNCGGGPLAANTNESDIAIPDFPAGGPVSPITSTINVTDTAVLTDLNVLVRMNHTFIGDVYVRLTGPNGTTIDLIKRPNIASPCTAGVIGDADDMVGNYTFDDDAATSLHAATIDGDATVIIATGNYRSSTCTGTLTSLDAASPAGFGGISAAGTWTLTVSDEDEAVLGTLEGWGLVFNGVEANSPCATSGACCRGATCAIDTQANCAGFANGYAGNNTVCNVFGVNNTAPCCLADYNHVGGITVQDIFDFLGGYFTADNKADINGGGTTVQDIFDYLASYFSGGC